MEQTLEEKVQAFKEILDNYHYKFERFEGWFEYHLWNSRFFNLDLLPSLCFFVDAQMNETFKTTDGEFMDSYIGVGLTFNWLGLSLGGQINFKTNKPLENGIDN